MDDDGMDFARFEDSLQMGHHPGESGQRTKRRLLYRNVVAGCTAQPAATGIDKAWLVRLRGERRQKDVKQATIDDAHIGLEITGRMNNGVYDPHPSRPLPGRSDIARGTRLPPFAP